LVIGPGGERLGVMPVPQAIQVAREAELDLVEVAPNSIPPVCRILDYGKFKYEQAKKERDSRKRQKQVTLREVRFKPKIDVHDVDFKTKTAEKLLKEGDKVKISVMFRGREVTHPEIGRGILDRVSERLKDVAVIEKPPTMEGRFMNMILSPVQPKTAKAQQPRPARTVEGDHPREAPVVSQE
jgi:translation initiation factor IF-3